MAKNTSGAVHLTSLDLDITQIQEDIKAVQEQMNQLSEVALKTGEDVRNAFNATSGKSGKIFDGSSIVQEANAAKEAVEGLGNALSKTITADSLYKDSSGLDKLANDLGLVDKEGQKATDQLSAFFSKIGEYQKVSLSAKDGDLFRAIVTSSDEAGQSIQRVYDLTQEFDKSLQSTTVVDNIEQRENAFERVAKQVENFALKYNAFTSQLLSSNVKDSSLDGLAEQSKEAEERLKELSVSIREGKSVTQENLTEYSNLSRALQQLKLSYGDAKVSFNELQKSLSELGNKSKTAISDLKILEKSATFSNSRKEASALRAEFEKLYSEIKNGNIDLKTAETSFASLETKLNNFKETVHTGTTAFQNFVNKISESAKWQVANSFLNMFQQAMGNVLSTITDTENAVIELRRVLSDAPIAAEISDELYQIAYDFGQTFENVQEVAVRFAQTGLDWQDVVDATRATMLGLNTAELEVADATEGLIAVMAQFGIEASDLESVIDKINKTADHFPVTSEKIVAALQRAGGTANAFGLTLEETIGLITALSEATGRAGESIGTALNSLITFSMKDTALEKFSQFLGKDVSDYGVLQLWQELSKAINGSSTELAKMMAQSEEFSDLMDETLATSVGLEEEYNLALKENNQALKDGKDIYQTVGTYRQNYFIALLNNIGTATDAIEGMGGALGYSLQENETAMSTFTKQWNQLVVSAQELAVQFGELGFLDIVKGLTDGATAALKFTKEIGGLNTVMLALATAMFAFKKQKINEYFASQSTIVATSKDMMNAYKAATMSGATATQAFGTALKTVELSAGGIVTIISAVVTVVYAVAGAMKRAKEEAKELRAELIQQGEEAAQTSRSFYDAISNYEEAVKNASEAGTSQEEAIKGILEQFGYELRDIPLLIKKYGDLKTAIEELTRAKYEQLKVDAEAAEQAAKESVKDITYSSGVSMDNRMVMQEYGLLFKVPETYEEVVEVYNQLTVGLAKYERGLSTAELATSEISKTTKENIKSLKGYIDSVGNAENAVDELGDSYEDWKTKSAEAEAQAKKAIDALDGTSESSSNASISIKDLEDSIEGLKKSFDTINKKVDGFQSAYSTLIGVIDEYNKTGLMTADMVQTILGLEPEYIDLLDISAESISINDEKLQGLIETNDTRIQQLAAIKVAQEAEALATQLSQMATENMTEAEIIAALTTQALSGKVEQAALAFLNGKGSADDFKKAIRDFATQCGLTGTAVDALVTKVDGLAQSTANALALFDRMPGDEFEESTPESRAAEARANIGRYYTPKTTKSSSGSSSKSTKDPFEEKLKAEKKALDDLIDSYEHQIFLMEKNKASATDIAAVYREMQKTVHEQAEKYRSMGVDEESDYIRDLQKLWWNYQDEIEEVLNGIYEATIEAHENALSLLENQYNKAVERMDYSEMSSNLQKQLDYQKKIQEEAHKEAQRLRQLGVDENDEAIQACIEAWWKADDAIQEINSRIEDSILSTYDDFIDLADEFDLWDYMDFSKVDYLRAKLEDINKLLKEGTISLKEYNNLLRQWNIDMFNAQKQNIEKQQDNIKKQADAVVKSYESSIKDLEKRKDDVEAYYDSVIDGYNAEIEVWKKRKEEVGDYYDQLIDNLNEVQDANDRINAQIDYYNSRQKIITNLEQAQARSGVAWREKEMEYQQQLVELDEDWNRTQQDWEIEDQIDQLQKLKEQATADIDATIEKVQESIKAAEEASKAAVDAIDQEIDGIKDTITAVEEQAELEIQALEDQIKSLSEQFAEAIKAGMSDGLIDSQEEFDKAVEDGKNFLLSTLDESSGVMKENAEDTAEDVMFCYNHSFMSPFKEGIDEVAEHMKGSIQSGAKTSAEGALKAFETSFVSPLKSSIASLMNEVQKINISYNAKAASIQTGTTASPPSKSNMVAARGTGNLRTSQQTPTTVYISNYNSTSESAANRTQDILQQILR